MDERDTAQTHDGLAYFLEYIHLSLDTRVIDGLKIWGERFTYFREAGRYDMCLRLLRGVKAYSFPPYGVGIVRYSGRCTLRIGHVRLYRSACPARAGGGG